jgi:hypothetical protein
MLHTLHSFGMSVGALQTYYHSEVYTTTPESVIALIGGLIAFVSRSNSQGVCLIYIDIDVDDQMVRVGDSVVPAWRVLEDGLRIACKQTSTTE